MTDRIWAMTRLSAGDYLLPSNDRTTLWRIQRYEERDGTLTGADGRVVIGDFWMLQRFRFPLDDAADHDLSWDEVWVACCYMLPTRQAAIAEAMSCEDPS